MKRVFFVLLIVIILLGFLVKTFKDKLNKDLTQIVYMPTSVPSPTSPVVKNTEKGTKSLFVPYWSVTEKAIDTTNFDTVVYFGIAPGESGINASEDGSLRLERFVHDVPHDKRKLLAVRMVDTKANLAILKDGSRQKQVIADSIRIAKQHGFTGVILDLEISAIPFDTLVRQINDFTSLFYQKSHQSQLSFAMAVYGDTFYRLRPFEVKTLAQSTDGIMIMAYDFHKANGNPGPNFPLAGKETYGYDLGKMADDFLQFVPPQKLSVVFGMFGYDWSVDAENNASGVGEAITDVQIGQKFLDNCSLADCKVTRDQVSGETLIKYMDSSQVKHSVWFEDMGSVKKKEEMLRGKGISSFSFWAYSYF